MKLLREIHKDGIVTRDTIENYTKKDWQEKVIEVAEMCNLYGIKTKIIDSHCHVEVYEPNSITNKKVFMLQEEGTLQ